MQSAQAQHGWTARTRVVVAVVLAAVMLGALGVGMPTASAHPGTPLSVFDPDEADWASIPGMTEDQFTDSVKEYEKGGFMVIGVDADVDSVTNELRLNVVYQRNLDGRGWLVNPKMTETQLEKILAWAEDEGLRVVDFETYVLGKTRYYAAVWVENVEGYETVHEYHLTATQVDELFRAQARRRLPVDVDIYPTASGLRWSLIWVDNPDGLAWALKTRMTEAQFDDAWKLYGKGMRMLVHDSAVQGTEQQLHAGIWVENTSGRGWKMYRDMSYQGYLNRWNQMVDEGYRLIGDERYETADGPRYSQIWRQDSDRPTWQLRGRVDTLVESHRDEFDVPGIAVAIMQDGKSVYQRGFGHADIDNNEWIDSRHVLRLASVSKGVGGVMTMRLSEQGDLAEGDPVSTHLPALPDHHSYTLGQLVSNRGCVRHYGSKDTPEQAVDDTMKWTAYDDAQTPAQLFWDDPLVCVPGQSTYSTHGYTILGAAFEGATGVNLSQLFTQRLHGPFDLGTLRPEDNTDASVRRAKIYTLSNGSNNELTRDELSWKVLGGGLESSAEDLALFGAKLLDRQIVSQPSLDTMWQDAPWTYAYGWTRGLEAGRRTVDKSGAWRGARSYMRMYPDDDVVIVVLSNRRNGGHSAVSLGKEIGSLIVPTLP